MLCLVVTTQPKLLAELKVSKHSKISRTGLEPGLLKAKECSMELSPCKSQEKIHPIQLSLIPVVHNCQSHQMFSTRLDKNGHQPFQTLTAPQIKLSVTLKIAVKMLHQNCNQLDSKWVIMYSKSTLNNTFTNHPTKSATSLFINADSQVKIRTSS